MIYICATDYKFSTGATLEEAYKNYINGIEGVNVEDCDFYEATRINVEMKITKKVIIAQKGESNV